MGSCAESDPQAALERQLSAKAAEIVATMDDSSVAAQLLLTGIDVSFSLTNSNRELFSQVPVGGVMFFKYNLGHGAAAARALSDACVSAVLASPPGVPPFVAVDHEGGTVHRFGSDATRLPAAATFAQVSSRLGVDRAVTAVWESAFLSGRELRALGITLNLAPVAEVADDRSDAFLGSRTYGRDADFVARAASAFVAGMDRSGVACAVKHFPGNVATDPHKEASSINLDRASLNRLVEPFKTVFSSAQPAAVMVSHAIVSAIDPDKPGILSKAVVTSWLRDELGFRGLIVTDDLRMGAIVQSGRTPSQAAVEAVAAGADLVMTWPKDLVAIRDALIQAVAQGDLSSERLRDAAARVVAAKIRYGLISQTDGSDGQEQSTENIDQKLARYRGETEQYLKDQGLR